ncbi:Cytochrome c oxidase subunit 1 [Pleodorina starrii]|uniref:Cytochrome c oxidase subunit 1 n=1 Tax=Pleodorina starrii TaxID=330485 RepID=A0A9W6BI85_9CHLO|nr:Cytochrome c oxidase subunit 1 [Pleodorina starrii]GLC52652.1 Cytochrome c oxidase subunit 1 [Pleodorina starrii]GLC71660.1 Cytochrome c oxidase subunit 1 [Pleodorina starrii]
MQMIKRFFSHSLSSEAGDQTAQNESPAKPLGTCVGDSKSCPEGGRLHAKIEGRYVSVLRIDGKLFCIDSICFHAGGPLGIGDIEDVNGHKCLVCPWHFYKIDIQTGDKYYQGLEFKDGKMLGGEWKSNGVRQRVHPVVEESGKIYVTLSTQPDAEAAATAAGLLGCGGPTAACSPSSRVESDGYAFDAQCGDRVLNSPPSANRAKVHSVGADGRKPSGQVLRGQYKS